MSETRRVAKLLVAVRPASFPSAHDVDVSVARLRAAIAARASGEALRGDVDAGGVRLTFGRPSGGGIRCAFVGQWIAEGGVRLEGRFEPAGKTSGFLKTTSIVLALLFGMTGWVWFTDADTPTRVVATLTAMLGLFAFPFVVLAFGSDREVEEIAIAKAIAAALA